jgi:formylglycine-generating enzyme required for sulfatase activity/Leucine-rich repeat (LRR) protein
VVSIMFSFETIFVDEKGNIDRHEQHQTQCLSIELGNGVNLDLVYIPGGSFVMGAPTEEAEGWERPQHLVNLEPFYMSKYPITQQQFEEVLHQNPAKFKGENRPVEQVDWHDAKGFCNKLSKQTGLSFELPSEAKWEYACRAGTITPFYFGATISAELANYHAETTYGGGISGASRQETSDVGMFPPNAFGLYDLHGNVWEWCEDIRYGDYQGAPTDGTAWSQIGPYSGDRDDEIFMIRGGSWQSKPSRCRSAASDDARYCIRRCDIGFRVVLIPSNKTHANVTDTQPISTPIQRSEVLRLIDRAAKEQSKTLYLINQKLTEIPAEIGKLKHLTSLNLSNNQLTEIPATLSELKNLTSLNLSNNQLTEISAEIGNFKNLISLILNNNQITSISVAIGDLKQLNILDLSDNKITEIPVTIGELKNLTELNLSDNQIAKIPATIGKLENLTKLSFYKNVITEIPNSIDKLINLKELILRLNYIVDLPTEIGELRMLTNLNLHDNRLTKIPTTIGKLIKLKDLRLANNQITDLPVEIGELRMLTHLDLRNNQLTEIPTTIGKLSKLIYISLGMNEMTEAPQWLQSLKNLDIEMRSYSEQQQDEERRIYEFKGSLQREFEELFDD